MRGIFAVDKFIFTPCDIFISTTSTNIIVSKSAAIKLAFHKFGVNYIYTRKIDIQKFAVNQYCLIE
jgi:hypothetical protein